MTTEEENAIFTEIKSMLNICISTERQSYGQGTRLIIDLYWGEKKLSSDSINVDQILEP